MDTQKVREKTAKWWQPGAIALLTAATAYLTAQAASVSAGRDARDEDVLRLQKAVDEQTMVMIRMRERQAWLEGHLGVRTSGRPSTSTSTLASIPPESPPPKPQWTIPVSQNELDVYQHAKTIEDR